VAFTDNDQHFDVDNRKADELPDHTFAHEADKFVRDHGVGKLRVFAKIE
jgi:hypothetical protein